MTVKSTLNDHETFARVVFGHFLRAMEREGTPIDMGQQRAERIDRLIDESIREARMLPTRAPMQTPSSAREGGPKDDALPADGPERAAPLGDGQSAP